MLRLRPDDLDSTFPETFVSPADFTANMALLAQSTCLCKPLTKSGTQARKQSVVSVRAAKRTDVAPVPQVSLQQKIAAAAAAAAIFLVRYLNFKTCTVNRDLLAGADSLSAVSQAPAASAVTPKPPTLGESQSSYAESLQNAVKERGSELKDIAPSVRGFSLASLCMSMVQCLVCSSETGSL